MRMRPEGKLEYWRLDLKSEMVCLRRSKANAGDGTGGRVRVSTIPSGILGSLWQPFIDDDIIDDEHEHEHEHS